MSRIPGEIGDDMIDVEIVRTAIIAELDAINLYEQMANACKSEHVKKVLLDIAKEEKTHVAELQTLLLSLDAEQVEEMERGKKEVEEILGGE
jgi:rubrerythrin